MDGALFSERVTSVPTAYLISGGGRGLIAQTRFFIIVRKYDGHAVIYLFFTSLFDTDSGINRNFIGNCQWKHK